MSQVKRSVRPSQRSASGVEVALRKQIAISVSAAMTWGEKTCVTRLASP
jgi:hypothetical protein